MSDQQAAMMAQQNPEMAQQVLQQNPQLAQQVMPGAMAAASSGMNAPNVSPMQEMMGGMQSRMMNVGQDPKMWQSIGGIGQMMRQNQPPQGALMQPQIPGMQGQAPQQGQIARKMPGVLMQVRPSRIY